MAAAMAAALVEVLQVQVGQWGLLALLVQCHQWAQQVQYHQWVQSALGVQLVLLDPVNQAHQWGNQFLETQ